MSKGVVSECFKFWWAYSTVFWDEKSIGDIFKTVRPTGLPNFAQQCCQIFKFHYNYHTRLHRKLKIGRIHFFQTRNRLLTFSRQSDQQGCHISHCRVARVAIKSNFTIIHIIHQIKSWKLLSTHFGDERSICGIIDLFSQSSWKYLCSFYCLQFRGSFLSGSSLLTDVICLGAGKWARSAHFPALTRARGAERARRSRASGAGARAHGRGSPPPTDL